MKLVSRVHNQQIVLLCNTGKQAVNRKFPTAWDVKLTIPFENRSPTQEHASSSH